MEWEKFFYGNRARKFRASRRTDSGRRKWNFFADRVAVAVSHNTHPFIISPGKLQLAVLIPSLSSSRRATATSRKHSPALLSRAHRARGLVYFFPPSRFSDLRSSCHILTRSVAQPLSPCHLIYLPPSFLPTTGFSSSKCRECITIVTYSSLDGTTRYLPCRVSTDPRGKYTSFLSLRRVASSLRCTRVRAGPSIIESFVIHERYFLAVGTENTLNFIWEWRGRTRAPWYP